MPHTFKDEWNSDDDADATAALLDAYTSFNTAMEIEDEAERSQDYSDKLLRHADQLLSRAEDHRAYAQDYLRRSEKIQGTLFTELMGKTSATVYFYAGVIRNIRADRLEQKAHRLKNRAIQIVNIDEM